MKFERAILQVRVGAACGSTPLPPMAAMLEGNSSFCFVRSFSSAPGSSPQWAGCAEFHHAFWEYLLTGRAAMPPAWSLVSHPKSKCPASLPGGWCGQGTRALRTSQEGATPADVSLWSAIGAGAREDKGFLFLFLWAVARKQDPMPLKAHLPNYGISL